MKRKVYTIKGVKEYLDGVVSKAEQIGFKRAETIGRRIGQSHYRGCFSEYEYINTRRVLRSPELFDTIEDFTSKIKLDDKALVEYILNFKQGDFLDWMDYDLWQSNTVGKFLSFALTDDNNIEFKNGDEIESIPVPKYSAIEFNTSEIHRVVKVNKQQTWLVLMVPDYLDLDKTFKEII